MKIVLIGIQGSGKSTQGNLLSKQLHIPYLSTGHIFRQLAKERTQLGRYIKVIMSSGALVPDEKVIEIVNEYLSRPAYKNGYILDGFPRTLKQAKQFVNNVEKVIHVHIPDKEVLWRLAYRNQVRDDETVKAIRKRVELFHTHTTKVIEYYREKGILVEVDGKLPIEEVNQAILKSLGKQKQRNGIKNWQQKDNTIIAVVGMPGAGKTEAADYLSKKYDAPIVSFSNVVNSYIDKKGLQHTLEVHSKVRTALRKKYGFEAMAYLNKEELEKSLKTNKLTLIEGMRSWEEYEYLKKTFPKTRIFIIAIYADKDKRYERTRKRKSRSGLTGVERDIDELLTTHMGPTIAFADYFIKNNFSIDDFHQKLDEVYQGVYYS
ncbi:nucleoside monophosphate kinase [Candidatus Woesebacteria bacterium]|nr:nucleoside monophosphate kinase [Candidatus Woesebacteria bacterium]